MTAIMTARPAIMRPAYSSGGGGGSAFFTDDFSSGDLSKTQGGFSWGGGNTGFVDVVNVARPGGSSRSVRFDYDTDNNAELDFTLPAGVTHLFLRYHTYHPNGDESPSVGPQWFRTGTLNNKLIRLSDAGVGQAYGVHFGASTYGTAVTGAERMFFEYGGPGFYNSPGSPPSLDPVQPIALIEAADRGAWKKWEWEFKAPTSTPSDWGVGNGIIRFWEDDVLLLEDTSSSMSPANTEFLSGYLQGYPNSPYNNAGTFMYLTDFAASTTGRV